MGDPGGIAINDEGGPGRFDGGLRLQRLLVERKNFAVPTEAVGAYGAEKAVRGRLDRSQPARGFQPVLPPSGLIEDGASFYQCLRKARIVVAQPVLEPGPVGPARFRQAERKEFGPFGQNLSRQIVIGLAAQTRGGAQHHEGAGTRTGKLAQMGQRGVVTLPCPGAQIGIAAQFHRLAQRPQGATVGIFRSGILAPFAIETHEVAECAFVRVPGVLDEAGIAGRAPRPFARLDPFGHVHQHQRADVVVEAIAMTPVGHGADRVLEHAGRIAHREDAFQARHNGQRGTLARINGGGADQPGRGIGIARPDRFPATLPRPLLHGAERVRIVQQGNDRLCQGGGAVGGDQHADVIGQKLARVDVRRCDHRLAQRHGIAERAGGGLLHVGIGRDEDIAGAQPVEQNLGIEIAVFPLDGMIDTQGLRPRDQHFAIAFPVPRDEVGMRGAHDAIDEIGMVDKDAGKRVDDMLQPLARTDQAKSHGDWPVFQSQRRLGARGAAEGAIRRAVLDDFDHVARSAIIGAKQRPTVTAHDHHPAGAR